MIVNPFLSLLRDHLVEAGFTTDTVENAPNLLMVLHKGHPLLLLDSEGYTLRCISGLSEEQEQKLYDEIADQFANTYSLFVNPTNEPSLGDYLPCDAENLLVDALENRSFNAQYL